MRQLPFFLLLLPLLAACPAGVDCDTSAAYSANVTVLDENGDAIDDADVAYAVNGNVTDCDAVEGGWACGAEVAGEMTIIARKPGYFEATELLDIEQGECHVVAQDVTLQLELDPGQAR